MVMKNAHLRMGHLEFRRTTKETVTQIRVPMDRLIAEAGEKGSARAHLISVFGGDQEIAAIAAALTETSWFNVSGPGLAETAVSLGEKATVFRASVTLAGRKRPLRHLVALSEELGSRYTMGDRKTQRTILCDEGPEFILHRISAQFGLPTVPAWSEWFVSELRRIGAVEQLIGFGCSPVAVKGSKKRFLALFTRGLKLNRIHLPENDSQMGWQSAGWFQIHRGPDQQSV
jgi:hypothetical protein